MQQLQDRPPFVAFSTVSVEDREETIKQGHYVGRDVDMALITPSGSKDRIERVVSEWLVQLRADKEAGRIPEAWAAHFERTYRDFKEGREAPINGTPVADWPGLSPTLLKTLQSLHLRAIEDVAAANEETISRLGMGGRSLKQRAVDYLAAANNVGKVAEEASAMRVELAAEKARNKDLSAKVDALAAQMATFSQGQSAMPGAGNAMAIGASDILDDSPSMKL